LGYFPEESDRVVFDEINALVLVLVIRAKSVLEVIERYLSFVRVGLSMPATVKPDWLRVMKYELVFGSWGVGPPVDNDLRRLGFDTSVG